MGFGRDRGIGDDVACGDAVRVDLLMESGTEGDNRICDGCRGEIKVEVAFCKESVLEPVKGCD